MPAGLVRGLFCSVVAVTAATVADPFVEAASNAGWFGRGSFTDHSNLDVVPALVTAAALALLYVFVRVHPILTPPSLAFARRLRDSLRSSGRGSLLRRLPAAFVVQLGVLYGMETVEQVIVAGHPLGGTLWLGAPVAIALALHGAACVLAALTLARALDMLARAVVDVALFVRATAFRLPDERLARALRGREPIARAGANPLASRSGKRAPPLLFA